MDSTASSRWAVMLRQRPYGVPDWTVGGGVVTAGLAAELSAGSYRMGWPWISALVAVAVVFGLAAVWPLKLRSLERTAHHPGEISRRKTPPDARLLAARDAVVRSGLLLLIIPPLRHGRTDIVSVAIGRDVHDSPAAAEALRELAEAGGIEKAVATSAVMGVSLRGPEFHINRLGEQAEQVVLPAARWDFEVVPRHSGSHQLTVLVWMLLKLPGYGKSTETLPMIVETVQVKSNAAVAMREHWVQNYQFYIASVLAAIGAAAAVAALLLS